jgi:hypothetical protein
LAHEELLDEELELNELEELLEDELEELLDENVLDDEQGYKAVI